jgi:hypothetical protein
MKRLLLFCSLLLVFLLAACGGTSAPEETGQEGDGPVVTVYSAPT